MFFCLLVNLFQGVSNVDFKFFVGYGKVKKLLRAPISKSCLPQWSQVMGGGDPNFRPSQRVKKSLCHHGNWVETVTKKQCGNESQLQKRFLYTKHCFEQWTIVTSSMSSLISFTFLIYHTLNSIPVTFYFHNHFTPKILSSALLLHSCFCLWEISTLLRIW